MTPNEMCEWLEADGLGGFASGTATGVRTRRYHALLLTATTPPTGRIVLVNGFDAWVEIDGDTCALSTQRYTPGVDYPDGATRIERFAHRPWPSWVFALPHGERIEQTLLVEHGTGTVVLSWRLLEADDVRAAETDMATDRPSGRRERTMQSAVLHVRPFLSGRDYHSLHHRNDAFDFAPQHDGARLTFSPYPGIPSIAIESNGEYRHQPDWYLNFAYRQEEQRGLDSVEDLASPGEWQFTLTPGAEAVLILSTSRDRDSRDETVVGEFERAASSETAPLVAGSPGAQSLGVPSVTAADVKCRAIAITGREARRRSELGDALRVSADAYIVARGRGKTIVAGYPWFTDWGRDTFIAIRGLCLSGGRACDARDMLLEWSDAVSEGMLPNRFADSGEQPEYNSVDASLWFVIAAAELLGLHERRAVALSALQRTALVRAIERIVNGYVSGTRFGIRADHDGLLACGVDDSQLTWMDARVDGRSITPRVGKPVEVQALWINALALAERLGLQTRVASDEARRVFVERFWNDDTHSMADVVDVNHVAGAHDFTCRPNQIFAAGGLPIALLDRDRASAVVDVVERRLLTPLGLRSLAPGEPGYVGVYAGGSAARDGAYHQGTVWPWLMGAFVDAWLRVRNHTVEAKAEARSRFFDPLAAHLSAAGLGHVSEIADGDAPHVPRGCPFQAWSLGELMRIDELTRVS